MNVLRLVPPQGDAILVSQDRVLVGRDGVCDVHLRDASVSRHHAEILREGDDWVIADLGSGNGVRVDGAKTMRAALRTGQVVQLGNVRLRVEIDRGSEGATMVLGAKPPEAEATMIARHPPRDPEAALSNLRGESRPRRPATPPTRPAIVPAPRPRAAKMFVLAALAGLALLAAWGWRSRREPITSRATPVPAADPTSSPLAVATVPAPTPAMTPAPAPSAPPTIAPPSPRRSLLLITTNERSSLSIDGQRQPPLAAGEMRRIEVMPGEHLLSFDAGDGRRDQVVRTIATEQSVVRFSGSTTVAAPPEAMAPGPPAPAPAPVPVGPPDEGVENGAAAARRGDFYRALLVLKDATARLDEDEDATRELARANAYLAWTYHALDRMGEAVVAADKAKRLDPSIVGRLDDFPSPVRALFARER